jgi:glycosyltransferase involved in cell wall biosynthesis
MDDRLSVLHVHSGNIFGGVETILLTCVRQRHQCPDLRMSFALCFDDRLSRELAENGAKVHALGAVRVSRPWTVVRARRALADLLRREHVDVAVVHSAWSHALFAPVVRRTGKPLIWWLHNRAHGTHWSERWARWTRPDLMLCVSQSTAETADRLYRDIPREVIYAPIPLTRETASAEQRDMTRAELQTPGDAVVIIQVSRMEAWKGHEVHLRALHALKDVPGWVCWQVGGPHNSGEARYFEKLKELTAELGLGERVRFLGQRTDVPRLLEAADCFCQPNLDTEGFSIAFMEAFLAGLPIVTSAIGGAVEIVDRSCGILQPVGDVAAVASSLRHLIADAETRCAMGAAGRRRVAELCDPATQLLRYKAAFERVANGCRNGMVGSCGTSAPNCESHAMGRGV